MSKKIIRGPIGDPTIVRQFTSHLLAAYDEFISNFEGTVDYVDGVMAAHNFHVCVIEHLVSETGDPVWREVAKTTFERRMSEPGAYDTAADEP